MSPRDCICIGIAALSFAAGWAVEGWRKDAEIERIKSAQADAVAKASQKAVADLLADQRVAAQVIAEETQRDIQTQEKAREIVRATHGRPCLGAAVVRLLNQPAGLKTAAAPAAASEPDSADAAVTTDTDVALWIGQCKRSYDTCRGRIDAIRKIDGETHGDQ